MKKVKNQTQLFLQLIDEAYKNRAWHGTNLRGSIRGLSAQQAAWRPAPTRHNIWEIVVHTAYWKYVVRRRLLGEKKGISFVGAMVSLTYGAKSSQSRLYVVSQFSDVSPEYRD